MGWHFDNALLKYLGLRLKAALCLGLLKPIPSSRLRPLPAFSIGWQPDPPPNFDDPDAPALGSGRSPSRAGSDVDGAWSR